MTFVCVLDVVTTTGLIKGQTAKGNLTEIKRRCIACYDLELPSRLLENSDAVVEVARRAGDDYAWRWRQATRCVAQEDIQGI